jgi:glycosyltransferase involved in cell wall biosynthesis
MPKVSILMNCYNGERYLTEAIDSIYRQSFKDFEIIFVDNQSTDLSQEIARRYDYKLRYFQTEKHVPLGAARNFGIRQCSGEYVAFLDTDDIWLPEKLQEQISRMDRDHSDLCFGSWISINSQGEEMKRYKICADDVDYFSYLLNSYVINFQTAVVRNFPGLTFDESFHYAPDFNLFMNIAVHNKVSIVSDPLVKYRVHNDSLSDKMMKFWGAEILSTLDGLRQNQPDVCSRYEAEFARAEANGRYLKSRYLIEKLGDTVTGRSIMRGIKVPDAKYQILKLLAYFPRLWTLIHKVKR